MPEIYRKVLEGMCSPMLEDGRGYTTSELGYIGLGSVKAVVNGFEHHRTPQGTALAIGRHLRAMEKDGYIKQMANRGTGNHFRWFKTAKGEDTVAFKAKIGLEEDRR